MSGLLSTWDAVILICLMFTVYRFRVDGEDVKIDIFDLAGQPYFYEVIAALPPECVQSALHVFYSSLATAANHMQCWKATSDMLPQLELHSMKDYLFTASCDLLHCTMCNPGQEPHWFLCNVLNVDYYSPAIQVRNEFYSGTHGALLAYDVTNRASFEALGSWLLEMRSHLADPDQDMASLVVVVCANKVCMYVRCSCSCCNVPYGWNVRWTGHRHLQMDDILLVPLPYAGTNSNTNVCVCVCACTHVCTYVCVCEHVCKYVYVCEHVCTYAYACICVCMRVCVHMCVVEHFTWMELYCDMYILAEYLTNNVL